MKAITNGLARETITRTAGPTLPFVDPLDPDQLSDDVVVTTRRGITRVALVAAEAGSRFQREGVAHDPMTWMLAPRRLFDGAAAIDACIERDACMPLRRVVWSQSFADRRGRDDFFAWLAGRVDRREDWGAIAYSTGAPALTSHLLGRFVLDLTR